MDRPGWESGGDGKNRGDNGKWGNQASHDFWGRQNCSPPRAPITHARYTAVAVDCFLGAEIIPYRYSSCCYYYCSNVLFLVVVLGEKSQSLRRFKSHRDEIWQ